jgi:dephospho-CoA kinase
MAAYRVGLTGGIAAGKSTVAEWLRQAGIEVIDADRLVARLYQPEREGAAIIAQLFGPDFLHSDGSVDHRRVADRIFSDKASRHRLEEAIHPLVKKEFDAIAAKSTGVVVLEAPLLVEAGFAPDLDLVITIEADPESRLQRAVARGLDPTEAQRRMTAQTSEEIRTKAAHRVIRNEGSLAELRHQIAILITELEEKGRDDR